MSIPLLPRTWLKNPLHVMSRAMYKYTIGRWRYQRGTDYAARDYWNDRLTHYGKSLKGPGWESMTEHANAEAYAQKEQILAKRLAEEGISLAGKRVLEVGCGTGYWSRFVHNSAPDAQYVGLDITDVQFPDLRERFPSYRFIQADITESVPDIGCFDVVLMLDVIEHIVTEERLTQAGGNISSLLAPGGTWIISGISTNDSRPFFYLRWWTLDRLRRACGCWRWSQPCTFGHPGNLLVLATAPVGSDAPDSDDGVVPRALP